MKKILIILIIGLAFVSHSYSASPVVKLSNFRQLSFPLEDPQYYGNVYLPKWSKNDRYVGVSFKDPVKEKRFVIIYDLENGNTLKYNSSMKGGRDQKRDPFARRVSPNDTHYIQWSPLQEATFFAISRVDKMDYLYRIEVNGLANGITVQNSELVQTEKVPVTNFSVSNLNQRRGRFYLLVNIGKEGSYDLNIFNVKRSVRRLPFQRTETIDEYDAQSFVTDRNHHIVIQGKINDQNDIFSFYRKSARDQSEIVNITNTANNSERMPRFNLSGNRVAYVRGEKLNLERKGKNTQSRYSLVVYDFDTQSEKILYDNIFVAPDVFLQNPFVWINDEKIIFVENNFDKQFPLRVIDVETLEQAEIQSPFINHKDLALSSDGKKIAFIAKGKQETKELSFDKLFICDIAVY